MKTLRQEPISLIEVEFIPNEIKPNTLYYSKEYEVSVHLCLCGCGVKVPIPIRSGEWNLKIEDGKPTLTPSLLQRFECKSHYIITKGIANFV